MTMDPDAFLMGAGGRSVSFKTVNDQVWGVVMNSQMRQQIDLDSQRPAFWDDGNPKMQLVITLLTEEREDDEDDGLRKVYVKGQMQKAIGDAVRKAKAPGIRDGGRLLVRYLGDAEPTRRGYNGAKQFFAKYEPPAVTVPSDDEEEPSDLPF